MPRFSASSGSSSSIRQKNNAIQAGDTITATADETAFATNYTIVADSLAAGDHIVFDLVGVYSGALAAAVTARVKIGATTVINTGSLTQVASASNFGWRGRFSIMATTIGASGSLDVQGDLFFQTAAAASIHVLEPNATPFTIDTTEDQDVDVTIEWNTDSASNAITLRQYRVTL